MRKSIWLGVAAVSLICAWSKTSSATAIAQGFSGSAGVGAYVTLMPLSDSTLNGLSITATPLQFSASTVAEGNGKAIAELSGFRQSLGDRLDLFVGLRMQATADATGHAIADAKQAYDIQITNNSGVAQSFWVQAHYAIGTRVSVTDLQTESVLAYWNVGTLFEEFGLKGYGEFGRTIDCSYPLQNSYLCPNFYDSNDSDRYPLTIAPGETFEFEMRAIARFEATAVPEPSTLALFAIGCLGAFAARRQLRLAGR